MLSLTRKTDYALVALTYLTGRRAEGADPVSAKQIAQTFGLPLPLLMNILKELVQVKVLSSTRGAHGGYELAIEPARISLLEVITAMDGPMKLAQCADGLPIVGQGCTLSEHCPIRGTIRGLHRRLNGFLAEVTLLDLWEDRLEDAGQTEVPAITTDATNGDRSSNTNETPPLADPAGVEIYQGA
jgi:Rrf2 family protein